MFARRFIQQGVLLLSFLYILAAPAADEFELVLKPLFAKNCVKCHGGEKVKGKVNLKEIANAKQFLAKPELIKQLIEVIDVADMPPEDEPRLTEAQRVDLLATLKAQLRAATATAKGAHIPLRRLNRFQYNNAVRDLFQLNRDVFALPEKLMTRQTIYLNAPKMPDRVNVRSLTLNPADGLREVKAFPKDLRASHGFDNQANQLTLSPLLLAACCLLSAACCMLAACSPPRLPSLLQALQRARGLLPPKFVVEKVLSRVRKLPPIGFQVTSIWRHGDPSWRQGDGEVYPRRWVSMLNCLYFLTLGGPRRQGGRGGSSAEQFVHGLTWGLASRPNGGFACVTSEP